MKPQDYGKWTEIGVIDPAPRYPSQILFYLPGHLLELEARNHPKVIATGHKYLLYFRRWYNGVDVTRII